MKYIAALALALLLSAPAYAAAPLEGGTFGKSCAPWDGGAVRFEIRGAEAYPQIGFSLFTGAGNVKPGSYDVPLDSHTGNVNYCDSAQGCVLAKKGTIELLDFDPWKTAHVSYDLWLDDGTELKGEASLTGVDERVFCG